MRVTGQQPRGLAELTLRGRDERGELRVVVRPRPAPVAEHQSRRRSIPARPSETVTGEGLSRTRVQSHPSHARRQAKVAADFLDSAGAQHVLGVDPVCGVGGALDGEAGPLDHRLEQPRERRRARRGRAPRAPSRLELALDLRCLPSRTRNHRSRTEGASGGIEAATRRPTAAGSPPRLRASRVIRVSAIGLPEVGQVMQRVPAVDEVGRARRRWT